MSQRIKAWWQTLITHFALSGQRGRYLSRFNFVDRIFKLVQWFAVIGVLVALAVQKKTTIGPFYQLVIAVIAVGLLAAVVSTLMPLFMAIDPATLGMGRGRVYRFFVPLVAMVIALVIAGLFYLTFRAIVTVYLPAPPPPPPPVETYSYS